VEQTKSSISVTGGQFFDLLEPAKSEYDIDTIATALSNICRYTGHVTRFYSVAEHSVLVSRIVPARFSLEGLLHDASEAFVGDVSSPLKKLLDRYQEIEYNIQEDVARRFGLQFPFPEEIHKADKQLYWAERKMIAPAVDALWHKEFRASRKVEPQGWTPKIAKKRFLARYNEIMNDRPQQI
jgi:5'-deoxynucleotidase YfbR-like HD superfamily hydrolase